jgi:hypothetical protein
LSGCVIPVLEFIKIRIRVLKIAMKISREIYFPNLLELNLFFRNFQKYFHELQLFCLGSRAPMYIYYLFFEFFEGLEFILMILKSYQFFVVF